MKVLVVYYSMYGHIEKMAQANPAPVTSSAIPKVEKAPAKVEASLAPAEEAKSEE